MTGADAIDPRHARDALHAIDPGCPRDEWHRIGRAAIAAGLTVDDLIEWSAPAANFAGERDVRSAFRSVTPTGGTGPGTLWKAAMEAGWKPPQAAASGARMPSPARAAGTRHGAATRPRGPSAAEVWARCEPATAEHPYIAAKHGDAAGLRVVPAGDALRIAGASVAGWLAVPVLPLAGGEPVSIQFIPPPGEGKKLNLPGASVAGVFVVGDLAAGGAVYLCEGIGQAWAVARATGAPAVCCFGWGRVRAVAAELRQRDPATRLVLVPDAGKEPDAERIAAELRAQFVRMPAGAPPNFDVADLAQRDGAEPLAALLAAPEDGVRPLFVEVDMAALEHDESEAVDWAWDGYIPRGHVTLFGGHGGAGKSTAALQLAACMAAQAPALGRATNAERVLFFSGEDDAGLVLKRLRRICRRLGLDLALVRERLQVLDASELAPVLFTEARVDGVRCGLTTPTYRALADYIAAGGFDVAFIDNASDAFDADEIARPLVREFIRSLKRLMSERGGAVVLLAHVDKSTSRAGKTGADEAYSGSTAWHNSVRSRLFLLETAPGEFELRHQKCNLGPKLPPLALSWPTDDVLHQAQTSGLMRHLSDRSDTRALLGLIHEFAGRGEWVAPAASGPSCVSAMLGGEKDYPRNLKPRDALALMRDAQRSGLVRVAQYRTDSRHQRERWELTAEGLELIGAPVAPVVRQFGTDATSAGEKPCAGFSPRGCGGPERAQETGADTAADGVPF